MLVSPQVHCHIRGKWHLTVSSEDFILVSLICSCMKHFELMLEKNIRSESDLVTAHGCQLFQPLLGAHPSPFILPLLFSSEIN